LINGFRSVVVTDSTKAIYSLTMSKIYDLLTVLESSTITSPHFAQAKMMIQDELVVLGDRITEQTLRGSVSNLLQSWRGLDNTGSLTAYVAAVTDLKAVLKAVS
jgi:hypothetical protein